MNTKRLWAPWRTKYIEILKQKSRGCVFCRIHREERDRSNYVFIRTAHSYAVLNIYPYNNGHTLIVPNRHVRDIGKLKSEEKQDLYELMERAKKLLDKVMKPDGYNIGINVGRIAGAGFPGHVHIHVVPRWSGDVNFMPVTSQTKIISQSLRLVYDRLAKASRPKRKRSR